LAREPLGSLMMDARKQMPKQLHLHHPNLAE
jgi:hypothetical protein